MARTGAGSLLKNFWVASQAAASATAEGPLLGGIPALLLSFMRIETIFQYRHSLTHNREIILFCSVPFVARNAVSKYFPLVFVVPSSDVGATHSTSWAKSGGIATMRNSFG